MRNRPQPVPKNRFGSTSIAGADGLGEDVSVFREDGTALHETRPALPLEGEWTLAGFCEHLAALELWPEPPEWEAALSYRRWAFESAALDFFFQAEDGIRDRNVTGVQTCALPI